MYKVLALAVFLTLVVQSSVLADDDATAKPAAEVRTMKQAAERASLENAVELKAPNVVSNGADSTATNSPKTDLSEEAASNDDP